MDLPNIDTIVNDYEQFIIDMKNSTKIWMKK